MFTYVLDDALGIMVARHQRGTNSIDLAASAFRQLGEARGMPGIPKLYLLHVERDAPHPDADGRAKLTDVLRTLKAPICMGLVTDSPIARAVFNVLGLLDRSGMMTWRAFADETSALQWFESKRTGSRRELERLEALRVQQVARAQALQALRRTPSGASLLR